MSTGPDPPETGSPDDRIGHLEARHAAHESLIAALQAGGQIDRDTITTLQTASALDQDVIAHLRAGGQDDRDTIANLHATAVVDQAMIEQLELDGIIDRAKIANLEVALISARRIGAAIGIVMAVQKVTEEQAFTVLRETSHRSSRKLRDVAEIVLMTGTPSDTPRTSRTEPNRTSPVNQSAQFTRDQCPAARPGRRSVSSTRSAAALRLHPNWLIISFN